MVTSNLLLQLLFIPISAIVAAATLLWMQSIYRRIKLLRGLEQEIQQNISSIGEAAHRVYLKMEPQEIDRFSYYDNVYRTVMAETPILYTQLVHGLSPLPRAYREITYLRDLASGQGRVPQSNLGEFLKFLEALEAELVKALERVKEVQSKSRFFRFYNRIWLKEAMEPQPAIYRVIEGDEFVNWRPSGNDPDEILEEDETNRESMD